MKTEYDEKMIRCPKLGDEMTFSYCLTEAGELPCARIITCWQAAFNVIGVLKSVLTPDQRNGFASAQPKEKILSLIELIEKAKAKK